MAVCKFDVDESGTPTPAVDALLLVRYLAGFTGGRLTDGAIQPNSTRRKAADVQSFLDSQAFDVDNNGVADPLTDGLIITRYLQDIAGPALVKGALGAGALRTQPDDVLAYLRSVGGCGNTPTLALSHALPIEVLGAEGTEKQIQLYLTSDQANRAQRLWLQTHNIRYPEKASVKINNGVWTPLNNTTAEMIGTSKNFGGIGGSFATLKMSLSVAANPLIAGVNTIAFRFNVSDNVSVGYRILSLNVLDSNGSRLIPPSGFSQSDPTSWTGPSAATADINAGKSLWATAALKAHFDRASNVAPNIVAKCADCHTKNGADLKYFGYSNNAIIERSKFHGLTQTQGEQIASYIRSLPVKTAGRPWNPPYQPGPGTSSKPNDEWAAGAGIDNVLENDWDSIASIFPNGVNRDALMVGDTTQFKRFNTHDVPIAFQLPDWNHWLPEVHPYDAFGKTTFEAYRQHRLYTYIRAELGAKSTEQIRQWYRDSINSETNKVNPKGYFAFREWYATDNTPSGFGDLIRQYPPNANNIPNLVNSRKIYSLALWRLVKIFELQEEFQLTGLGADVGPNAIQFGFNAKYAQPRAWVGAERTVFDASPFLLAMNASVTGSASGNSAFNFDYLSNAWYQLQIILNPGHREGWGHRVVDWGYAYGFLRDIQRRVGYTQDGRNVVWAIKGMDEGDNDRGPNRSKGWSFRRASLVNSLGLSQSVLWDKFWVNTPTPEARQVLSTLHQVWLEKNATWLPVQYWYENHVTKIPLNYEEDGGWFEAPAFVLGSYPPQGENDRSAAENHLLALRQMSLKSTLPAALINGYATWAQAIWPGRNPETEPISANRNNWLQHSIARVGSAPPPPTVVAAAAAGVVNISWSATAGAQSYNVKRSDSPNGPFMTIAYFRTGSSYSETVPLAGNGFTYYYRMSTNSDQAESPDSSTVQISR